MSIGEWDSSIFYHSWTSAIVNSSEDCILSEHVGHRVADWEDQIKKGVEDVMVGINFELVETI